MVFQGPANVSRAHLTYNCLSVTITLTNMLSSSAASEFLLITIDPEPNVDNPLRDENGSLHLGFVTTNRFVCFVGLVLSLLRTPPLP